jgi:hypothetical protein
MQNGAELRDKHIGELLAQLGNDTSTLVRQEMALARAELSERLDVIRADVAEAMELARDESTRKLDRARRDVKKKGKTAGVGLGMFGAAGVASLLALGTLSAAIVLLLDRVLATDLAALLVGLAWALVAAAAALRGREKVHEIGVIRAGDYVPTQTFAAVRDRASDAKQLVPEQTIETLKEDVEWAKTRGRSERT